MKSLLEYAPPHLIKENDVQQPAILTGMLPASLSNNDAPIEPTKAEWVHNKDPQSLSRLFEFENFKELNYFLDALLYYQEEVQHHATLIIEARTIYVETYTHTAGMVTESDTALANFCDDVYGDLLYMSKMRKERSHAFSE